jgi:hypothetical protein
MHTHIHKYTHTYIHTNICTLCLDRCSGTPGSRQSSARCTSDKSSTEKTELSCTEDGFKGGSPSAPRLHPQSTTKSLDRNRSTCMPSAGCRVCQAVLVIGSLCHLLKFCRIICKEASCVECLDVCGACPRLCMYIHPSMSARLHV